MRAAVVGAVVVVIGPLVHGELAAAAPGVRPTRGPARPVTGRAARPVVPAYYFQNVRSWHTPAAGKTPPTDAAGRPMLVLRSLYTEARAELTAASALGGFAASDLDLASQVLREPSSGNRHPVEPRVLDALYRIQVHFHAQEIRVLSGYRTPVPRGTSHGNHGRGRAVDFVVPGAADDDVVKFARELGFVGVGIYPLSGFVHVDVRERSYFWIDRSGPGRRNRERGILTELARKSDAEASARGERPPTPLGSSDANREVDGGAAPAATDEDEDE